jgi:putative hydrolase of the HAD superfamily
VPVSLARTTPAWCAATVPLQRCGHRDQGSGATKTDRHERCLAAYAAGIALHERRGWAEGAVRPEVGRGPATGQGSAGGPVTCAPVIRAALFDFGGVILSSPFETFARFEAARGLPAGFLRSVNATDPDTNAWARLERSEVTLAEFDALFASESLALGHEVSGRELIGLLSGELRPAMVEAVRRCSQRLITGLLTNNFVVTDGSNGADGAERDRAGAMGGVLALFDGIVESSKVGVRKPDVRFYELACAQFGIEPAEAVFLDDLGVNLKPARALGMTTIKVDDPAVAIAELEAVVGFPLG